MPAQPAATSGTAEAQAQAGAATGAATGAAASRQQAEPGAAEGANRRAQAAQTASAASAAGAGAAAPDARAAAAASAGEASGDGAARGEGEPPSGNPKKPLLAAAGIAGVVLLAVPLLIWATDDSEKKKDTVSAAANSDTVLNDEPLNAPPGDYAPAKPTAQPTTVKPSAAAKAKSRTAPTASAPVVAPPPPPPPAQNKAKVPVVKSTPAKEETYKPPPNTASLAVMQLATQSPGRHICYRAYVKDIGWQRAVCDGGTAGTTGQNRPIQALNIAVSGTNGTAATAWTQAQGYKKDWTSARDGGDLYLGNATKGAPNLGGFAINVGSKVICQNAHLNIRGWGGLKCDNPGGENFIFGGSLENPYWLEAVRFTV